MLLSTVLSSVQVLQSAITITDCAAAYKIFLSPGWHWSQHYVNESFHQRITLFAWHLVAVRAEELEKRWGMLKTRATTVAFQMRDRLGFVLVPAGGVQPGIEELRASNTRSGRKRVFTRIELSQYQRRAMLALPGCFELHRILHGLLCGQLSSNEKWLFDDRREKGACRVFELPSWTPGENSVLIYASNDQVVGILDPAGHAHVKPRKPSKEEVEWHGSNFMPPQVNWKRRVDGDLKTTAQREEEAVFPTEVREIPAFDVTRIASRAAV
eukprot:3384211-Rhodomonas_salina.2